jgi:L-alanine-DL-glutamate epimerase-like enolase superfamily enzyme
MGQPVYRVLGGYRPSIPAYASSGFYGSIDEYLADARRCFGQGYHAYKLHPLRDPDRDIKLCEAMRAEFGGVRLMLDVTSAYSRADALRVGRALERLGFHWYEEPLSHYDYEGNRELRLALDIPIAGAETMSGSAFSGGSHLAFGSFDLILCDVYWKMGITGMMKLARACEALHVRVASHHGASPLMNWANLHCLCAIPNVDFIEVLVPEEAYDFGLRSYARTEADGNVTVSDAPGLGIETDWGYVDDHTTSRMQERSPVALPWHNVRSA